MNETVFREILGESLRREFAEFDNAPKHKFSLKHRLAMRRIFARYEKNTRPIELSAATMPHYNLKQRVIFALVIIILMTLLTGWFFPIRGITEAQIDWLRARYDFASMRIYTGQSFIGGNGLMAGLCRETDEYGNFLADLEQLGIYSPDEIDTIRARTLPMDTRPKKRKTSELHITPVPLAFDDISLIDSVREFVSTLENDIEYYTERSKDPDLAEEGDAEFAALIKERYWSLHNGFLELLEKLLADDHESENGSDGQKNSLVNFDKDDKRHLLEINKI